MLEAGLRLGGRYEILAQLGAGGMGEVYRARDLRLDREVAIKILPERMARSATALGRFEREAKALATLSHPNILNIHDFSTDQNIAFLVMELLEGETLRSRLSKADLTTAKALQIAVAIAEGLSAAHSRGVMHRDLKPENIFLTSDGTAKILDFGLARMVDVASAESRSDIPTISNRTEPGLLVGTVNYMSPEQVRGLALDARTDIFSLGCILFEMFTGARPFVRNAPAETLAAILKEDPFGSPEAERKIPSEVKPVIAHCLEKNREERFQSARDLAFALKAILSGTGISRAAAEQTRIAPAPRKRRSSRKTIDSIAVLPLANASGETNMEYLSDGITESIINSLSQLPKLRVMARSTVFRYKGQQPDPQRVGDDLGVRAVLTGRVVQRGDTLSIQTELVDVADGSQLWGEQYKRNLSDIFAVQEEISSEISEKLRLKLSGEEKIRLVKRYTADTEAYQLYLKARYHWSKRTGDGFKKAIEYFQEAIAKDPQYALAYAGVADCYNLLSAYGVLPPSESVPIAWAAANKALDIDSSLAEGHEALAHAKMLYDWDWSGAETEFKQAIDLNPNYATAHQRYAIFLAPLGRLDEAGAEIRKAQQLDPLSLIINTDVGLIYYFQARYDDAIEQFHKTLDLDPNFYVAHFALALALEQKERYEEAIAAFQHGISLSGDRTFISSLAHTYALYGMIAEAERLLEELKELSKSRYVSPYRMAIVYAGLGEKDESFKWLHEAFQERSVWLIHLHFKVDPRLAPLHSDPRFNDLLQGMGLSS